jgi:hypothetical protein
MPHRRDDGELELQYGSINSGNGILTTTTWVLTRQDYAWHMIRDQIRRTAI